LRNLVIINGIFLALMLVAIDVVSYRYLPDRYIFRLAEYRQPPKSIMAYRSQLLKDYFESHPSRGFDIARDVARQHSVDGLIYPVWSNSLGCFDVEHIDSGRYVYFAGDSFTWGFTPFEEKFATIIEKRTKTDILKCGVTHTGQRHQYEKFVEIVDNLRSAPQAVFVFFYSNDLINDYAYPHSTIIDGWQVNTTSIDGDHQIIRHDIAELREQLDQKLKERDQALQPATDWAAQAKTQLKQYSLSVNLLVLVKDSLKNLLRPTENATTKEFNFYYPAEEYDGKYWYLKNPRAENNKLALMSFKKYSEWNGVPLIIVLLPRKAVGSFDVQWYGEVRQFLDENNIRYIDLSEFLNRREESVDKLYWRVDEHFNPSGNQAVAEILIDEFPEYFRPPIFRPVVEGESAQELSEPVARD
jgi:hypothetical protein